MSIEAATTEAENRARLVASLRRHADLFVASKLTKFFKIGRKLAYAKLVRSFLRTPRQRLLKLFWGGRMMGVFPEPMSLSLYCYGVFESDVSNMLLEVLRPGMTFYDIGAHFGYFTCLAAELTGPKGEVHSFEPTPSTFQVLSENARTRPTVKANNVAAYSHGGEITFEDFGLLHSVFNSATGARLGDAEKKSATSQKYQVRAITIDDYSAETNSTPDLIKLDAENAEYEILAGMQQTLRRARPAICMEVGDMGKDAAHGSARVVEMLEGLGYSAVEWKGGTFKQHVKRAEYGYGNLLFRA